MTSALLPYQVGTFSYHMKWHTQFLTCVFHTKNLGLQRANKVYSQFAESSKLCEIFGKFTPYLCLSGYFFNINSYINELKLGFRVGECHYCLNSRTCLNRKHYIMLPPHCIVLVSFRLCWLYTNSFTASCFTALYHTYTVLKWPISLSF